MYVSRETPEQTTTRLLRVLAQAEWRVLNGSFAFREWPARRLPAERAADALALVRDEDVWSVLGPAGPEDAEPLLLFSFHFPPGLDNSGFVGWLASHLKSQLGTGVLVVCGQNSGRGGIFDYWGVPFAVGPAVVSEVGRMRGEAGRGPTSGIWTAPVKR